MRKPSSKKVVAVLSDLFFTVKINEAAKRAGLTIEFVKSEEDALAKAREQPLLVILDLNCNSLDPLNLVARLKSDPDLKGLSVIGFLSHVQGDLKQKAHETGCDMVLARSAFSQSLPQIFKRHQGVF